MSRMSNVIQYDDKRRSDCGRQCDVISIKKGVNVVLMDKLIFLFNKFSKQNIMFKSLVACLKIIRKI